ncbi:TonB-dependent receptor [Sphingomonas jatrophae]|uniref:Iron complex outermembrane recepter protein n=1 Tax=Sphingomonas jatrophae TaxID=1166337 RepID=A0A1I6MD54_9SPHN|nr:TonB-dependent receptor [Sphingomonas jatrophae]SFS13634.1 iron complex outermembrane recepter protein [Sphingomonas jatrophae]
MARLSRILAALAASTAAFAAPALAQDTQPSTADTAPGAAEMIPEGGDIVVTARRREETLRDVPIAITAFTGEALTRGGAIDITDLSNVVPNVTLEVSRGTNSTLTAFVRGVGQQDPVAGFEAGVGLYLDDVYLNRPQAAVLDIYDVERIEVLRGPQGTLYGRNTIGGAVKYVTRRLGDDPTISARATYGSYDQADGVVSASAPIGNGTIKLGGAVARLSRGGFGKNLTTGDENYNKDIWAGRATLQIEPSKEAFLRITGDYTKDKSAPRGGHRLIPGLATGIPPLDDVYDTRAGLLDPKQEVEAWGVSAFAEVKPTDWLTFRSITAYRKDDSASPIDFDSLAAVDVDVPAFYNNKQFSQEVQALVDMGGLSGLLGAYYLDASARTVFDVRLPAGVTAQTFGNVKTNTGAIFGDFTYDLSEQLSVSAGGRYTWDDRDSTILRRTYLGGGSPIFGGTGVLAATTSNFRGQATFKEFTPRASVSFKPTPDHNVYASYAKGFKGGGFDPRGQSTACRTPAGAVCTPQEVFDFLSFDPETVDSYEVGYKAALFDRRLNIALAAFRADYKDVQVPGSVGTLVNGQQTFIGVTTNAGKARIQGLEFEGSLLAARDLAGAGDRVNLSWTMGYIDAEYKRFIDARGINVADRRAFQNTPKWTASGTLAYSVPVGSGSIDASGTLAYRSRTQQFELRTPGLDQKGYALLDGNIVWTAKGDRFSIGLHGRNLTNKKYIVSGYNFLGQNPDTGEYLRNAAGRLVPTLGQEGVLTAYYGNPRQVFVTVGVKF